MDSKKLKFSKQNEEFLLKNFVDKKKSKVLISFKCFKITLRDTNMCVGTYLGSLVLSETLSYSYQNIVFQGRIDFLHLL